MNGDRESVNLLLAAGADPAEAADNGCTPAETAPAEVADLLRT
jgi:hypothetical protein